MSQYWFKQKRYGLGATPSSREGWLLTGAYVLAIMILGGVYGSNGGAHPVPFFAIIAAATVIFVGISWAKTEGGWRWRWGDDDRR